MPPLLGDRGPIDLPGVANAKYPGTGIGLAICTWIVELRRGGVFGLRMNKGGYNLVLVAARSLKNIRGVTASHRVIVAM